MTGIVNPKVGRADRPAEHHQAHPRTQGREDRTRVRNMGADLVEWHGKRPRGEGTPGAMALPTKEVRA